jgi:hypothetical protein
MYSIIFNVRIFDDFGANLGSGEIVGTGTVAEIEGGFLGSMQLGKHL